MCEDLLTIKEAAYELGVSERTIERLVVKRMLVCISLTCSAGCKRIPRDSLEAHMKRVREQAKRDLI
jgi:predicted DNA-binding transcriptional regulator YafY